MPLKPAERDAMLTLIGYELRQGKTVEEAAKKYNVSLRFAQKATQPRRRRQRIIATHLHELVDRLDQMDGAILSLGARMQTLDETLYEMIDLVSKEASQPAPTTTTAFEQP